MAVEVLLQKGWHLTPDGLEQCKQNGNRNTDSVVKAALNTDLREIGEKFLPDDINRGKVDYVQGPCVLQIQKIRNVSAPKDNEDSQGAPRLLKFTLTDGHQNCGAVEIESVDKISLNTPPGTKIQLLGTVQIEHGFLLLSNKNARFLGGTVDKMVETWQLKRSLAKQSRALTTGEGGAPPFVPFGQRITQDKPIGNRRDNFKSLESGKEKKEEDGEFEQQRQATIKEALQGKQVKTFGGMGKQLIQDRDVARIVEMGFSSEEATCALKQNQGNVELAISALLSRSVAGIGGQRGRGYQRAPTNQDRGERNERGDRSDRSERSDRFDRSERPERGDRGRGRRGREAEGEDVAPTRPSGPATLFDFLETKITIKDEPKSETKESSKKYDSQGSAGRPQSSGVASRSQPSVATKTQEQRSQGQGFSQNRRQNLPPRLANKYNRDTDTSSGSRTTSSGSRPNSSYNNYNNSKQSDGSERGNYQDRNNYRGSENRNNYGSSGAERSNYRNSDRNSYPNAEKNNYGDYENRNNYGQNSDRRNYNNGDSENRNNYGRGNYSSSDRNSNRDRSGRADNSDRSHPRTSSYQKPDFSNPPPPIVYDSGGQYTYQQQSQPYRPNTVAQYNMNYNNSGQTEWGQHPDYQTAMSTVYMQNNGDAGSRDWHRGDKCLAQYSGDGQYYNAVIEALSPELPTCVVFFTEYGNSEEVYLDSLRTLPKYGRNDVNWGSGPKMYSSQSMKHHQANMSMPQGMAYASPIPGDESLFAANHITTMEFRRGGQGNTFQKRPDRQGGRNQPFCPDQQRPPPTSHY